MSFNQFSKLGTPIHKKTNLNLNLEEGQLEFPIHDIQSIFKIWNSYPQKSKYELELERGST
jgi:hypothetical protein